MAEHAVLVTIPLDDDQFGSEEVREALLALEDDLGEAVSLAECGECDGHDFGQGTCTLYLYGPDADELFMVIEAVLSEAAVARGGYATKRYGAADDAESRQARITW